ncbi:MAG: D-tyrosyl-tRNA(Tyr) deacylase [Candidatus Omnitrophica bacterium]|nr:D-tyrosyl-tRNA(Tyr) deacylase [Candidatus Omnitrophota bacterium]
MKAVIQRVRSASVTINGDISREIGKGMVILAGIQKGDTEADVIKTAVKITKLRLFEDDQGKMNLDINAAGGEILSVSQFTLLGDLSSGNRPGFDDAEVPQKAKILWELFNCAIIKQGISVKIGDFGAIMLVKIFNDGPVTFVLDSKYS